jgi:hypothetical protein
MDSLGNFIHLILQNVTSFRIDMLNQTFYGAFIEFIHVDRPDVVTLDQFQHKFEKSKLILIWLACRKCRPAWGAKTQYNK